jgi:hypothetical protein
MRLSVKAELADRFLFVSDFVRAAAPLSTELSSCVSV